MRIRSRHVFAVAIVALVAGRSVPAGAAVQVQSGIGFIAATGAAPGAQFVLQEQRGNGNGNGPEVARGTADTFGSLVFRDLEQGRSYLLRGPNGARTSVTVRVFEDHPEPSFYHGQTLVNGFQYIQARDGTLLAAMVRPPLGFASLDQGPFPTVVEYSGYPAADPDSPQASTQLTGALGYATVAVNMRGTGCSGGVLDLFDLPTTADGYDVIETVAAQPWVKGGKVGMVGISFPGISQTFVAGARPPHLAAVAPLSVIADIYRAPGFPGGIFNNGFAQSWLQGRADDAEPAPAGGQDYARKRVNQGDQTCLANQGLRLQTQDPIAVTRAFPFYTPSLMDNRSPINWVGSIEVPTFLSSAWQDEQTGFAEMLSHLPNRPDVKIAVTNGVHTSPLDPVILWNWAAFLDIYVAERVPDAAFLSLIAHPFVYPEIIDRDVNLIPLPADRFDGITDYALARALFESDPHVQVFMENGAGSPVPGLPAPTFELGFGDWPPPQARPTAWYFGSGGTLSRRRPRGHQSGVDSYRPDPDARPEQTLPGVSEELAWNVIPPYDWRPLVDGTALAYATPPLEEEVTIAGPSSVDLWLRSSAADTDFQVTLSEIRPDGLEVYVQNGWLRASHRRLERRLSSAIEPRHTHLERHAEPLAPGRFTKVRVGIFSVAHVFRRGSRIRVSIEAPGGDRPRWRFDTPKTQGSVLNEIARESGKPSRLVLAVVPDIGAPAALPPCPGLRGQPCRTYVPATNGG